MTKETIQPQGAEPIQQNLFQAVEKEGESFRRYYLWLQKTMPRAFFEEITKENLTLITHSLMGFDLQDYFSIINRKSAAIVLCLDSSDADLRILRHFTDYGIKNYQAHVSKEPALFPGINAHLRIATIDFTEAQEEVEKFFSEESKAALRSLVRSNHPDLSDKEFDFSLAKMSTRFLFALPPERLALAVHLLHRAQTRDRCQYEVRYEVNWQEKGTASMYIVLAWRNTPKHNFLYRLACVVYRHGLSMKRVNAIYTDPSHKENVLVMALSLHGSNGKAAWEVADIPDFLRELVTVKYFEDIGPIEAALVAPGVISGNMGSLLFAMVPFIHQVLVHLDSNLYTFEKVEEALCRHPELTSKICDAFKLRFDPDHHNAEAFVEVRKQLIEDVAKLDTGQESNDLRRKNVLYQAMNFVTFTLKTNFYCLNYTALSFRLDPKYLDETPFDRPAHFPVLPYAIFYIRGMHFFGFHIRFKDLARGGLRTIYPSQIEQMAADRDHVFNECYHLAWTQHKKNKDIPEGGAKAVLFLQSFVQIDSDSPILKKELQWLSVDPSEIDIRINAFREEQKIEFLYQSQRNFIESFLTLINCDSSGDLRARLVVDYWKKPEYIYLGPDENMHDIMIEWIGNYSKKHQYKPGGAFISGKPHTGINHKEFGVTSLGVNVYMDQILRYMGIDPEKQVFTIKMSGGPDGDVAGNQLLNLYRFYPNTAKLTALTDGTGTIFDEQGLDLSILKDLFHQGKGICFYPAEKLSLNGFLVNKNQIRYPTPYMQETLCLRKTEDGIIEDWLSGSETNHLLRFNLHKTKTDIFIPAGGRPATLNETNVNEFLDEAGSPTSRAIIEGANLYLNAEARIFLEKKGVLIIKDSSANKGGVICSSFEVLCGLALDEKTFLEYKTLLVAEILERVHLCSLNEAKVLLTHHQKTGENLTLISDRLSDRLNLYTYQLLDYLDLVPLGNDIQDLMVRNFLYYCLPTLRNKFSQELLTNIPPHHKKAIIACHLSSYLVYTKGIDWSPSIVDILPIVLAGSTLVD